MKNISKKYHVLALLVSLSILNFSAATSAIIPTNKTVTTKDGNKKEKEKYQIIDKTIKPLVKFDIFTNNKKIEANMFDISKNMNIESQNFLKTTGLIPMDIEIKNNTKREIIVDIDKVLKYDISLTHKEAIKQIAKSLYVSQFTAYFSNILFSLTGLGLVGSTIYFRGLLESLISNGLVLPTKLLVKHILENEYLRTPTIAISSLATIYSAYKYFVTPTSLQNYFLKKFSGMNHRGSKFFASTKHLDPIRQMKNDLLTITQVDFENEFVITNDPKNDANKKNFLIFISQKTYNNIRAGVVQPQLNFKFTEN